MRRRTFAGVAAGALAAALAGPAWAQAARPRATVTPVVAAGPVEPGTTLAVRLEVALPADIHVQAHEPRDPLLIPTVLTVQPPAGVTVDGISYPAPAELPQAGRVDALLVLGPVFAIDVRLSIGADVAPGELLVPAVLRYQACNDAVCFPPARASVEWRIPVTRP